MVCMALQVTLYFLYFPVFRLMNSVDQQSKKKTAAETVINHNERKQMKPKASAACIRKQRRPHRTSVTPNLLLVSKNAFSAAILYTVKSNGAFNYALKSCLYFKQLVIRYIKEI